MKKCAYCKEEKEYYEFARQKSAKDGLHPYCRKCNSEISKETEIYKRKRRHKLMSEDTELKEWVENAISIYERLKIEIDSKVSTRQMYQFVIDKHRKKEL